MAYLVLLFKIDYSPIHAQRDALSHHHVELALAEVHNRLVWEKPSVVAEPDELCA